MTDHDPRECPGCYKMAEYRIIADVYGCEAGRGCVQVTPEQREAFEKLIAERIAALTAGAPEGT